MAYSLGHYITYFQEDTATAEQLFFECVFILDMCKSEISGSVPIISELGTNALLKYSEVLLTNGKYQYAILGFQVIYISVYLSIYLPIYLSDI